MIAKNGAVKKDRIVAIFINTPMLDMKKMRRIIVLMARKLIQNQYKFL